MNARYARAMVIALTALGLILIYAFYSEERSRHSGEASARLDRQTERVTEAISQAFELTRARVKNVVALFSASDIVTEQALELFVRTSDIFGDGNHIRAVAVMPLLGPADTKPAAAALRARASARAALGYPSLEIVEDLQRQLYAPALYVESPEGRAGILGYDLASDADRLETALAASRTGDVLVTPPVILSQDSSQNPPSVLLLAGISQGDMGLRTHLPPDISRPIFVAISFTPARLIDTVLARFRSSGIALDIVDYTDPRRPVSVFGAGARADRTPIASRHLLFGGREWLLQFFATGPQAAHQISAWDLSVYALSVVLLFALALAANGLISNKEQLAERVKERTAELSEANAKLRALSLDAQEANRAKSAFLASMSHEFRTPLNAVLGFSEILAADNAKTLSIEKYREYAGDIHQSGAHLLALVDDILDLAKVEAGRTSVDYETLDSGVIFNECLLLVSGMADLGNVRLTFPAPHDAISIHADRRALKQILINLLSNAIKFTASGGMVTVSARRIGHASEISISDTGVGIPEDRLSDVLVPFVRVDDNPHVAGDGSGLGLSITKSLIDLHGGRLVITSKPGKGTTVVVSLPDTA